MGSPAIISGMIANCVEEKRVKGSLTGRNFSCTVRLGDLCTYRESHCRTGRLDSPAAWSKWQCVVRSSDSDRLVSFSIAMLAMARCMAINQQSDSSVN